MDQLVRYAVALYVGVDFGLVVAIVAEGVEDLGEGEVGQVVGYLFGQSTLPPHLSEGTYGGARAFDNWLAAKYLVVGYDV